MSKFHTISFLSLLFSLIFSFATDGQALEKSPSIKLASGVYHSFSETHWYNKIELKANGEALIYYESIYGSIGYRETKEYDGKWLLKGNLITVKYGNSKDTFEFSEGKFWEPQSKRIHGLTLKSKGKDSILVGNDLWKGIR